MPVLEHYSTNPALGLFNVNLLRQLRGPNPLDNIEAQIAADIGPVAFKRYYENNEQRLAFWWGGNFRRQVLLIDGVRSQHQANALLEGYAPSLGLMAVQEINNYCRLQARAIGDQIGLNNFRLSEHLDVVGYSAGGAVGMALVGELIRIENFPTLKLSTFGAPRTGKTYLRDALSNLDMCRWMTSADPIPLVPLRLQDAPQIALIVPTLIALSWSSFCHPYSGLAVKPNGDILPAVLPPDAEASPVSSVASWLWGIEDDNTNPHSLVSYFNALTAAMAQEENQNQPVISGGHGEQPNDVRSREVQAARRRSEAAVFTAASNQTAVNPTIPEPVLFVPYRQGRVWYVSFGDQTIIIAGPEKRARHIARAGNDFVRSLLKQACVSPETILGQLNAFMVLAQDPTSGIAPTMRTSLPE